MKKESRRVCVRFVPLAACLAAALALPRVEGAPRATSVPHGANVLPVTNCDDDGSAGTLRSVVASAASGDTVDMSALACATITLAGGAIPITVADLTLQGPGADRLGIDGANAGRVISHAVAGTLTLNDVSLVNGHYATGTVLGGCLYSNGPTHLNRVTISSCSTAGGAFAFAGGAGLAVNGDLTLTASTLSNNTAAHAGSGNYFVVGGGAIVIGNATVIDSTISGNASEGLAGTFGYHSYGGGIVVNGALTLRNSTIAFNTAGRGAGGIFSLGYDIAIDSTIVADNGAAYAGYFSPDIGGYGTLAGANNLIVASDLIVPDGTLSADPLLLPLANNGGPTATLALASDSPAIDAGDNASSLPFDQRGEGYLRVSGVAADIGAFEYQQSFAVPTVSKSFAPDTVHVATPSTLTITLTNPNRADATLTADLVDTFPSAVVVATPADGTTDCPGGTAVADGSVVTLLSGAKIPAEGHCTVTVTVISGDAGTFTNTIAAGALETDQGADPSPASANLTVTADAPSLAKAFVPATIPADETTTLTITLTNTDTVDAVLSAALADHLPPSLTVAAVPNASTTCAGGELAADPGSGTVSLSGGAAIPAGGTCTVTVDIAAALTGVFTNTIAAGALDTNLGASATAASASLTVTTADRIFAAGFDGAPIAPSSEDGNE
jgi:hypothetical protein